MECNVVALARQAAAAASAERAAQEAAMRPVRKYRGVQRRRNRFAASIWNPDTRRPMWLGSYATPEEAAYAYDAAARRIQGLWARPNFPEPSASRAAAGQVVVAVGAAQARATAAPVLTNLALAQAWRAEVLAPVRTSNELLPTRGTQAPLLRWEPAPPARHLHDHVVPSGYFPNNQHAPVASPECFFRLPGPTAGATAHNSTGLYRAFPSIPGGYVPVTLNDLGLNCPASSEQSRTEPESSAAATVPRRRRLAISPAMGLEHGAVVGDNFSNGGASSSVPSTSEWW